MIRPRLFRPCGAGDVEMRPRQAAGEFLQEQRSRDRTARPAAGVGEVGNFALQLIEVVRVDRHAATSDRPRDRRRGGRARPTSRACRTRRWSSFPSATTIAPVSVATSTRCVAPSFRAYQSPSPRISRPSASVLITSTVLPSALFRMSPGLMARPPGMFSVAGTIADDANRRAELADRAHGARDSRAAGHVVLHPFHAVGRLDRDAAGVERDALADQAEHRVRSLRADRGERPSGAAVRCCLGRRRAAVPCRAPRSDARREFRPTRRLRSRSCAARVRKFARRQRIARLVRQLTREIAAFAQQAPARDRHLQARHALRRGIGAPP